MASLSVSVTMLMEEQKEGCFPKEKKIFQRQRLSLARGTRQMSHKAISLARELLPLPCLEYLFSFLCFLGSLPKQTDWTQDFAPVSVSEWSLCRRWCLHTAHVVTLAISAQGIHSSKLTRLCSPSANIYYPHLDKHYMSPKLIFKMLQFFATVFAFTWTLKVSGVELFLVVFLK